MGREDNQNTNDLCTCKEYRWGYSYDGDSYRCHESECGVHLTKKQLIAMRERIVELEKILEEFRNAAEEKAILDGCGE